LSSICFGSKIINKNFLVEGIRNIEIEDILFAKKLNFKIKLLAIAEKINNKIKQRVHPCLIPTYIDIANINGVTNAIVVDGSPIGRTVYEGPGAGKGPTSSSIISDIASIMVGNDDYSFGFSPKSKKNYSLFNFSNHESKYYLRFLVSDRPGVLSTITSCLAKNKISVESLVQNPNNSYSNIVIVTHASKESSIKNAISILAKNKKIFKKIVMIRVRNESNL